MSVELEHIDAAEESHENGNNNWESNDKFENQFLPGVVNVLHIFSAWIQFQVDLGGQIRLRCF